LRFFKDADREGDPALLNDLMNEVSIRDLDSIPLGIYSGLKR
jgi:hypothetical protein